MNANSSETATPKEVAEIRTFLRLTQAEIGRHLGVGYHTVYRWEAGIRPVGIDHTKTLRRMMNTAMDNRIAEGKRRLSAVG